MTQEEILQAVLSIAQEIFEKDTDERDDFFSLGGDSINAVELATRLEELLGEEIDLADLWGSESFHEFAVRLTRDPGRSASHRS